MIELRKVTKTYSMGKNGFLALRGVDLLITSEEFTAITGPSGSGKSTLLHIIGALHHPTSGQVLLEGNDLSQLSRDELARVRNEKIGFVFQRFHLLPGANVLQNVELPLVYAGVPRQNRREMARECLAKMEMTDRASHRTSQLSGGESQRVAIARALVNDPRLLLADEPTGNLDSRMTEEIMAMFIALHEEGRTVVIVTHEENVANKAKRRVIMRDGMIEEDRSGID